MAAETQEPLLITNKHPKSPFAEAFRTLRTNLAFTNPDLPSKILLITSTGPLEGKSTTIANLAVVLAQGGNRTLVIDADLRKPTMHKIFEKQNQRGLSNALVDQAETKDLVQATDVPNLNVITSGPLPPNPAELLGSARMKALLPALAEGYDHVLFDTPPVLAVTDAAVLASLVDGVILVARAGSTRIDHLKEAKAALEMTGVRLIGTVLNGLRPESDGYYYYHYRYYYTSEGERVREKHRSRRNK